MRLDGEEQLLECVLHRCNDQGKRKLSQKAAKIQNLAFEHQIKDITIVVVIGLP